jgi:hypothetical protein
MSNLPPVTRERSTIKAPDTTRCGFIMSALLHLIILFSAVFFHEQPASDNVYSAQSHVNVMQARLVFAPVRLPVIEGNRAGDTPTDEGELPYASKINNTRPVKEKVGRASDQFDDALALAEIAVLTVNSAELQRTVLEPTTIEPDMSEPVIAKKTSPSQLETFIETPLDISVPLVEDDNVKRGDVLAVDPLLAYQQQIGLTLQRNLRLSKYEKIGRCVLLMELSRDGMVLKTSYVSGSKNLCGEAERAAIRVGRMPMPADDTLYAELTKLYVTVTGTGL